MWHVQCLDVVAQGIIIQIEAQCGEPNRQAGRQTDRYNFTHSNKTRKDGKERIQKKKEKGV